MDVVLREVGMRDGLQSLSQVMPTEAKIAWCTAEHAAGVREIEVTSLVPPRIMPQFADAEAVVAAACKLPGLTVSALIPNLKGAERGIALGVHKLNFVVSVSESHNRANVRRGTAESLQDFARISALCRASNPRPVLCCGLATSFGCTIEGAIPEDRVRRCVAEALAAGADEIVLADTVGYADPRSVGCLLGQVLAEAGSVPVAAHFHDTRGLGLANVAAALGAGVRAFDASLAGLGGCPFAPGASGNIVMEDAAYLVARLGHRTGIDLARLVEVRAILARHLPEVALLGQIARAGLPRAELPPATAGRGHASAQ